MKPEGEKADARRGGEEKPAGVRGGSGRAERQRHETVLPVPPDQHDDGLAAGRPQRLDDPAHIAGGFDGAPIDSFFRIPDSDAIPLVFALNREEGICLGGSSGINVAGAVRLAEELGPGHTIVTLLCDGGTRYQSKLFNPAFLAAKGLPVPDWL